MGGLQSHDIKNMCSFVRILLSPPPCNRNPFKACNPITMNSPCTYIVNIFNDASSYPLGVEFGCVAYKKEQSSITKNKQVGKKMFQVVLVVPHTMTQVKFSKTLETHFHFFINIKVLRNITHLTRISKCNEIHVGGPKVSPTTTHFKVKYSSTTSYVMNILYNRFTKAF